MSDVSVKHVMPQKDIIFQTAINCILLIVHEYVKNTGVFLARFSVINILTAKRIGLTFLTHPVVAYLRYRLAHTVLTGWCSEYV